MKLSRAMRPARAAIPSRPTSASPAVLSARPTCSIPSITAAAAAAAAAQARSPRRSSRELPCSPAFCPVSHPTPLVPARHISSRRAFASSTSLFSSSASPGPDSLETREPLRKTALYELHLGHGAKMVPFGGFHMPVQYAGQGVGASHHWTRERASLFDVGHMAQHRFAGAGAAAFLQRVTPAGLGALPPLHSTLTALLWPRSGGIVDDAIVARLGPELFYVVTNAACRAKDLAYLDTQLEAWRRDGGPDVRHEVLDGWGLVALQGPLAEAILAEATAAEPPDGPSLRELHFGQCRFCRVDLGRGGERKLSDPLLVSRGGYTGEDGFEISIPPEQTVAVTERLLDVAGKDRLQLAGLGARDSLRLEAGMCLYGHDLDDTTTPVEAALGWIVPKDRRDPQQEGAFHGADVILKQLTPRSKGGQGVERRRVGLEVEGAPAREGAEIVDKDGQAVGVVTSGCPSPTTGKNIAMGYIKDGLHKAGTEVGVVIRGKERKATVRKMPFVPTKYWKGTAPA